MAGGIASWYGEPAPTGFHGGPLKDGSIYIEFPAGAEVSPHPNIACNLVFVEPDEVFGQAIDLTLGNIHEYIRDVVIPTMRKHVC